MTFLLFLLTSLVQPMFIDPHGKKQQQKCSGGCSTCDYEVTMNNGVSDVGSSTPLIARSLAIHIGLLQVLSDNIVQYTTML